MISNEELGRNIKAARKSKRMTLKDVADIACVNASTVQRYENGKFNTCKMPVIKAIAEAIGVPVDLLLGGNTYVK